MMGRLGRAAGTTGEPGPAAAPSASGAPRRGRDGRTPGPAPRPQRAERASAAPSEDHPGLGQTPRQLRALVARLATPRVPTATYRLQFHAGFTFRDGRQLVPYLHALGVSDVYASPYLKARSGSPHGYDVADPNALNPELGTEEDYADLVAELSRHGMGHVADIVPNHMGIGDPGNFRWLDVLENGPASLYAKFFDIDWHPLKAEPRDRTRLVLPGLGDQYGKVLEDGQLALGYRDGAFWVQYFDQRFPLAPETYAHVLQPCLGQLEDTLGRRHEQALELASILYALGHLPPRAELEPAALEARNREKEIIKRRIRALHAAAPPFRQALHSTLDELNGREGSPESFDRLDALLDAQSYRLASWRVAAEEINYRRFFDIHELAAVRMEDPAVFQETHRLLLRLVREGKVSGLRIDHPDGLCDPAGYFWRLQRSCFAKVCAARLGDERCPGGRAAGANSATAERALEERLAVLFDRERARNPRSTLLRSFYVVAEKILSANEELPPDWPIHGTTGYEFLSVLNGLFVERNNERLFDAIYARFVRGTPSFRDLANSTKKMVMLISLASEVNGLGHHVKRIAGSNRRYRDFTLNSLTFVIREIIAALPVYRTYVDPESGAMSETDREHVGAAVAEAKRRNPRTDPSIFDFVRDTLLQSVPGGEACGPNGGDRARSSRRSALEEGRLRFVARFQQTSGPVMAKGVEDTAFYLYNRLVSLNEVGGEPERFGVSLATFHRHNRARQRRWPSALLATSTHDTKRSEDVRARINVLSEMPREWRAALARWGGLNGRQKPLVDGRLAPSRNEEYLLYQTLLGAWPLEPMDDGQYATFRERIAAFVLKALKEAKVNTSWIHPNVAYEGAVQQFVRTVLDTSVPNPFLRDLQPLRERVAHFGAFNSLSQVALKIASPGVPDVYQGNELWDFSLVDPDNRRPVDFALRARLLESIRRVIASPEADLAGFAHELVANKEDGRVKLYVTYRGLVARREDPSLFARGTYIPLRAEGPKKRHVCAFARVADGRAVIVAAPVLVVGLTGGATIAPLGAEVWGDTWLRLPGTPGQTYRDLFTGESLRAARAGGKAAVPLADVFQHFPVALLRLAA